MHIRDQERLTFGIILSVLFHAAVFLVFSMIPLDLFNAQPSFHGPVVVTLEASSFSIPETTPNPVAEEDSSASSSVIQPDPQAEVSTAVGTESSVVVPVPKTPTSNPVTPSTAKPVTPSVTQGSTPAPAQSGTDSAPPTTDTAAAVTGSVSSTSSQPVANPPNEPVVPSVDLSVLDQVLSQSPQNPAPTGNSSSGGLTQSPASKDSSTSGLPALLWDDPAQGRELISYELPRIQDTQWTGQEIVVSFGVSPEGLITEASITSPVQLPLLIQNTVLDAVRDWRFKSANTAQTVRGSVTFKIVRN